MGRVIRPMRHIIRPMRLHSSRDGKNIMQLLGIHHLTAITANVRANKAFYTDTLGLRLVKKTVNQDDVSAYHLFYADGRATPGTDITFFGLAAAARAARHAQHRADRNARRRRGKPSLLARTTQPARRCARRDRRP